MGKKIFRIKIIDIKSEDMNQKLSWKSVILRQILDIIVFIPQTVIPVIIVILIDNWQGYNTYSLALNYYNSSALGRIFSIFGGIIFLSEVITMLINEENRSLHDLIAHTVVVEE